MLLPQFVQDAQNKLTQPNPVSQASEEGNQMTNQVSSEKLSLNPTEQLPSHDLVN